MSENAVVHSSDISPPAMRRGRIYSLDLARAIAIVLIVITHYNVPYFMGGNYVFTLRPFGIYVGDLGVSLFLMVSGAALMTVYGGRLDLKKFYWKRFKGIYPMFWTAWILATAFFVLARGGSPLNTAPPTSFIYTILGLDGWLSNFGVPTFYLVGEWFVGFILIFYIVFPLLRWGVEQHPLATALIVLILYGVTVWFFWTPGPYPGSIILTMRLPELLFGMYFVRYFPKIPPWTALVAAPVLILFSVYTPFNPGVSTTAVGISVFVVIAALARFVAAKPIASVVNLLATYSYAIFLIHHVVIFQVFSTMDPSTLTRGRAYAVFFAICIVVFGLSVGLFALEKSIVAFFTRAFKGVGFPWRGRSEGPAEVPREALERQSQRRETGSG